MIDGKKTIGMICRVPRPRNLQDHIYLWMHRAMVIEPELKKSGYTLFCYTPVDVDRINKTARGAIFQDGQFLMVTLPVPQLNYYWHVATSRDASFDLKEYDSWAVKQGIESYPSLEFRMATNDKMESYYQVASYDTSIAPYTEDFSFDVSQLQRFLALDRSVFIKPRMGKMGNDIFVVRLENGRFVTNYYFEAHNEIARHSGEQATLDWIKLKMGDVAERRPLPPKGNVWEMVLARVKEKVSPSCFDRWLKPTTYLDQPPGALRVRVPEGLFTDRLTKHYIGVIKEAVAEVHEAPVTVQFIADYIIQRGITALREQGGAIAIRAVILNDGNEWHILSNAGVSPKGSDICNIHQGSRKYDIGKVLNRNLPAASAQEVLDRINVISSGLAAALSREYRHGINEFAVDFIVDQESKVYVAEINSRPGLLGVPYRFVDFFNQTEAEKRVYESQSLPHGKYLAQFLLNRANASKTSNSTP